MSIRRIFLALVAPLFVLLAAVNGGLLYVWEKAEAEKGLEGEAIAAAVTVAAFLSTPERTRAALSDAVRAHALEQAVVRSPGLEGVWIVEPGRPALRLAGAGEMAGLGPVAAGPPRALPVRRDQGGPHVLGLADAGPGRTVVARIDAAPLFERVAGLQRLIALLIAGAGGVGLVLALVIARMIGRELARNSAQVAADDGAPAPDEAAFRIRETRDLGAAVRLMRASVSGRMARGRRELLRRDGHAAHQRSALLPRCRRRSYWKQPGGGSRPGLSERPRPDSFAFCTGIAERSWPRRRRTSGRRAGPAPPLVAPSRRRCWTRSHTRVTMPRGVRPLARGLEGLVGRRACRRA